jgi:hypothetical protein
VEDKRIEKLIQNLTMMNFKILLKSLNVQAMHILFNNSGTVRNISLKFYQQIDLAEITRLFI